MMVTWRASRKKSLYSSRKMSSGFRREELMSMSAESAKASYLRRKKAQGKAQFGKPEDEQK
jgi:hypothetical protein